LTTKLKIAIISSSYPYGKTETFLHNEILILSKSIDIVVFPIIKKNKTDVPRQLPNNVVFNKPILSRSIIKRIFFGIFNLAPLTPFLKDLFFLFKNSNNIKSSLNQWVLYMLTYRGIFSSKKFKSILKSDTDIIYFYWGKSPVGFLKKNIETIIRIHGAEVDLPRNNNYIPLLDYRIVKKDNIRYLPISTISELTIRKLNDVNCKLSRLGTFDFGLNNKGIKSINDKLRIVSCSNMIPLKRIHIIIKALMKIMDTEIKWVHFGDGPLNNKIELLSKNLPSNITCEFKGRVKNEQVLNYYQNNFIDLFINVSETEGIPVSIMEAFSFGIPCFATDVGGTNEIVNSTNGYLANKNFKLKELTSFLLKIKELSRKENLRENARKTWTENYNANANYKNLVSIIENKIIKNE